MVRVSNGIVCIFNFIYVLVAIPIISAGIWFKTYSANDCQRYLQWPTIILGVSLLALCLFGIIGSCCRVNFFLWIYLFFMFLLILAVMAVTVFALVIMSTYKLEKEVTEKIGLQLGYSNWLEKTVVKDDNWVKFEGCLKQSDVCDSDEQRSFFVFGDAQKLLEEGCCQPPPSCGFKLNGTTWQAPDPMPASPECDQWSDDKDKLCYECNTCKGVVLLGLKGDWKKFAIFSSIVLAFLIMMYSIGCCAFRNNRSDRYKRHYHRGYHH